VASREQVIIGVNRWLMDRYRAAEGALAALS
jgi:hypothetical protein